MNGFFNTARSRIAIIAYHSVRPEHHRFSIQPKTFERQIDLIQNEYEIIRLNQINSKLSTNTCPSKTTVIITFDDAFSDFLDYAYPILAQASVPATIFVPTGLIGKYNSWDYDRGGHPKLRILSGEEIRNLSRQKLVDVGSHSVDHVSMGKISPGEMRRQISDSKQNLETLLERPVQAFSYPYGQRDDVPRSAIQLVAEAGYQFAVTGQWGTIQSPKHLLQLPRIFFRENDLDKMIRDKIEGRYDWIGMKERVGFMLRLMRSRVSRELLTQLTVVLLSFSQFIFHIVSGYDPLKTILRI
jgi:peptidoglycan/xylan/chitin deacetylase (PgdA/CDA1 family)